jgi:hypothetical protein
VQCPLTIQEFGLLLKATVMLLLTENYALQGTYPRTGTNNSNEFVSYPVAVNTYPIYYGNMMMLPRLLLENFLALRGRMVYGGRGGINNPCYVQSCLGQYRFDRLVKSDYKVEYTVNDADFVVDVFADDAAETEINFIDGSYSGDAGTDYACINDPFYLVPLANKFNEWIQGLGNELRTMTTAAFDDGVVALSVAHFTTHWLEIGEDEMLPWKVEEQRKLVLAGKRKSADLDKDKKKLIQLERKKNMFALNTVYSNRKVVAETANGIVVDSLWGQFQQFFVTPINRIAPVNNDGNNTGYYRVSGLLGEPGQLTLGSGSVRFESLADKHENFANLMIKNVLNAKDELNDLLVDLSKKGEGGILGDVTGFLVGQALPAAMPLAGQFLSDVIPI